MSRSRNVLVVLLCLFAGACATVTELRPKSDELALDGLIKKIRIGFGEFGREMDGKIKRYAPVCEQEKLLAPFSLISSQARNTASLSFPSGIEALT